MAAYLLEACKGSRPDATVIKGLLGSLAGQVDRQDSVGRSALWLACHGGHVEVVELLLEVGNNQECVLSPADPKNNTTPGIRTPCPTSVLLRRHAFYLC